MTHHTSPQQTPAGSNSRGVAITTAIVGGIVLLVLGVSAAFVMIATRGVDGSYSHAVDASGARELSLEIGAADFTLEFGKVKEATLATGGSRSEDWTLRRDGDEILVEAPRQTLAGFCLFGFCPSDRGSTATAKLTLPMELADGSLDADVTLGVGVIEASGTFGELDITVAAGDATVRGVARSLELSVEVGAFTGELDGVERASVEVSVGDASLRLNGQPPQLVDLQADIGSIDLAVPSAEYAVVVNRSMGSVDSTLRTSAASPNRIEARVNLGDITLRETR